MVLCGAGVLWSFWAKAEYRAFLLAIQSPGEEAPRLVKSNLDPWQYKAYYPIAATDSIKYIDTWRCRGRTGGLQPICQSPKELAAEQNEATGQAPEGSPEKSPEKSPERKPANN